MYNTDAFNDSVSYPHQVKINDDMFFQLKLNTSTTNMKLAVQDCYATKTADSSDMDRYYILQNK